MPISLRAATAADQPAIDALIKGLHLFGLNIKWPHFVVAVDDATQQIVAMGQIKRHGDRSYELASIGTAPGYRGRGLARQIIEYLLAQHPGELYLMCVSTMGTFYEPFGFRPVAFDAMPPYFKRMHRLAAAARLLDKTGPTLLVMRRAGDGEAGDKKAGDSGEAAPGTRGKG